MTTPQLGPTESKLCWKPQWKENFKIVPHEEIVREAKLKSMKRHLHDLLCVDMEQLQARIDEIQIKDLDFRHIYSDEGILPEYGARFDNADAIINDIHKTHKRWLQCKSTTFLMLKEYADGETRSHINHDHFGKLLLYRECIEPDFTVQLGVALLKKNHDKEDYDKELEASLDKIFKLFKLSKDRSPEDPWLAVLKDLSAHLERRAIRNQKTRILVEVHGAGLDQAVELVNGVLDLRCHGLSPIFQALISGFGTDRAAKTFGWETIELAMDAMVVRKQLMNWLMNWLMNYGGWKS
ncbi:hypothetical protein SLS60_005314 [Paraconiothyrium brasiliense]|uniref:Uncharacterized protein n=1 Tax=Paraconiothyrium brasiliense TaxID=300254 RepID=A0ABR3RH02_9PLEO